MSAESWSVPREWAGETAFILGGGDSLEGFDPERLRDKGRIIAIKEAGLTMCPWSDALYWTDGWWFDGRVGKYSGAHNKLHIHTGPYKIARARPNKVTNHDIKVLETDNTNPLSTNPKALAGKCSGGAAINLAFLFGAKRIVLLGFDMQGENWDGRKRSPGTQQTRVSRHMPAIARMAVPLQQHGVRVLNATPGSALKCFPVAKLEDILADLEGTKSPEPEVAEQEVPPPKKAEARPKSRRRRAAKEDYTGLELYPATDVPRQIANLAEHDRITLRIRTRGADIVTRRPIDWWHLKLSVSFAAVTVLESDDSQVRFDCGKRA